MFNQAFNVIHQNLTTAARTRSINRKWITIRFATMAHEIPGKTREQILNNLVNEASNLWTLLGHPCNYDILTFDFLARAKIRESSILFLFLNRKGEDFRASTVELKN